jgi:molybdate transport system regulatory protein
MPDKAKKRAGKEKKLRVRVWVEGSRAGDGKSAAALTEAGADLLEQIEAWGSLSEAARRLTYSYRRAWLLVDGMNGAWGEPLVELATGGKGGGGARLTERGRRVLAAFRQMQVELEHFLGEAEAAFLRNSEW